jgi:hypothetical protein
MLRNPPDSIGPLGLRRYCCLAHTPTASCTAAPPLHPLAVAIRAHRESLDAELGTSTPLERRPDSIHCLEDRDNNNWHRSSLSSRCPAPLFSIFLQPPLAGVAPRSSLLQLEVRRRPGRSALPHAAEGPRRATTRGSSRAPERGSRSRPSAFASPRTCVACAPPRQSPARRSAGLCRRSTVQQPVRGSWRCRPPRYNGDGLGSTPNRATRRHHVLRDRHHSGSEPGQARVQLLRRLPAFLGRELAERSCEPVTRPPRALLCSASE